MPCNYNGQVLDQFPNSLQQTQRALFYGDGLFESIRMFESQMPLLPRHWARLSAGLSALGIELLAKYDRDFFQKEIEKVATGNARIRLMIWRSPGGLYLPETNMAQFLISTQVLKQAHFEALVDGITLGLAEGPRLPIDAFSNFKTLNSARYVAAAREAAARGWDDALLLNSRERICEASSSNVFWWEGDTCCTVPLSEGCVEGVMRSCLLERAAASGYAVQEKAITFTQLQAADEIFLSNAIRGIVPVRIFAGRKYGSGRTRAIFDPVC